jgi:hypothetical protein
MPGKGLGRTRRVLVMMVLVQAGLGAGVALAAHPWAGSDPKSNLKVRRLPSACYRKPTSEKCVNAGVYYLDKARAKLHQKPYKLPADFAKRSPEQQVFILVNLDRLQYKLPPMTGLTNALDRDAMGGISGDPYGVRGDGDPRPTDRNFSHVTADWAGGYPNIVFAYEGWMYNDGHGSPNLDCTKGSSSGCWAHRHDVLWKFAKTGPAAMGAAAGKDKHGTRGFAILLGRGNSRYHPKYAYTWDQAVADGASKHKYPVHKP